MKILIIGNLHHKNKAGLIDVLNYLQWTYKFGTLNDIVNFDIIYSPSIPFDPSSYPTKKIIFGPHFSVFPDHKMNLINNKYNNAVYIQPSKWVVNLWINMGVRHIPIKSMPFPVNINLFSPKISNQKKNVFIYFKRRQTKELNMLEQFLNYQQISYKIFDYVKKYEEGDYLNYLKNSKYGIILDAHESQGFAIEEALSCNVPLLVWNTKTMNQEYGSSYRDIPCTTIPYWDERCGECFYDINELEEKYDTFISKLDQYEPRQYIVDNLNLEVCSKKLLDLIQNIPN